MQKAIQIHIPQPCHEDWQQMTPVDKGRFCQSCAKQVVDFSLMSDQQILNYISNAAGKLCGRFAEDQLQRPLLPVKQEKKKMWWIAAMMPLVMVFGKVGAQKKTHKNKPKENIIKLNQSNNLLGEVVFTSQESNEDNVEKDVSNVIDTASINPKITVWRTRGQSDFTVTGRIENFKDNTGIPFATVTLKGTRTAIATDEKGRFILKGHSIENYVSLNISSVGFESKDVEIFLKDSEEVHKEGSYNICGRVTDISGMAIPFAIIKVKDGKEVVATGANGAFNLTLPQKQLYDVLTVSSVGFEDKQVLVSIKDTDEIIVKCSPITQGLSDIVAVGGAVACYRKPKKIDTIPTIIRKVFNSETFILFPNPAQRGQNVTLDTKKEGTYSIQLFNNGGKLLQVKEFNAIVGATQTMLNIPSSFAAGIYYIRLVDDKTKKQYTDKLIVQ